MSAHLPTDYQSYIHASRYARFLDDKGRREHWGETVGRYFDFFEQFLDEHHGHKVPAMLRSELEDAVLNLQVMPSMRALMTAGEALRRENIAGYNCSYLPIDRPRAFAEALYVMMCGTGVGFSCERQVIARLPEIAPTFGKTAQIIQVGDSKRGWALAYEDLVDLLFAGWVPEVDYSLVRPAGERLKVFGGRASGPDPLRGLFEFTIRTFRNAAGRRLNSLEVHELICKVGDCVVVGGVRRSALISLSNLSDQRMRDAKSGDWRSTKPHLQLSNNSVAYTEKPEPGAFMDEWSALYRSKSGERGIFNRAGAIAKMERLGKRQTLVTLGQPDRWSFGCNPCAEIVLRPRGLCNLTEAIARRDDSVHLLREKVRLAAVLGTWQATLTNFNFVEPEWEVNAREERLLGVSLTGIYDHALLRGAEGMERLAYHLDCLRTEAVDQNADTAAAIGIPAAAAVTTVKPSGTVSQLVDCRSGIHPAHAEHYIRRIRADNKDPVTRFMIEAGVPSEPCVTKPEDMTVFSFPISAPGTVTRNEVSAIDHLELVQIYNTHWSEHAVSCTVSVRDHEWPAVGGWVYDHFDALAGLSFLPHFEEDTSYAQLPYETIDAERYCRLVAEMPQVDWTGLSTFEVGEDSVTGTREFACQGNVCEVLDAQEIPVA